MSHLELSNNKQEIIDEVNAGKFSINMEDHVLHLKSFIDKDLCDEVVKEVNSIQDVDKSSQYTDGLLNNHADTYFDPEGNEVDLEGKSSELSTDRNRTSFGKFRRHYKGRRPRTAE